MSIPAQFVYDVKFAVKEKCEVATCLSSGGNIMSKDAVLAKIREMTNQ